MDTEREQVIERLQADMQQALLSDIEDYCILFGTSALPVLRDYLARATAGWAKRPDLRLVEEEK